MRRVAVIGLAAGSVLVVAGVGAWQLLPSVGEKNDAITVGTTDEVSSLDPAGAYDAGSWALFSNVYQSLLTMKTGSQMPVPDAASSCRFIGQKLTTYQCELRPGVKFSNGREITAADVKFSFDRIKAIKSDQGPGPLFNTLRSVSTQGRTITFNLSARDATFPFKIASGAGSIVDKDKYPAAGLRTGSEVDGSGVYTLKSFTKGQIELTPNDSYSGNARAPHVPVTIKYYEDSDQLNDAWTGHEVDVAHRDLPPNVLAGLNPGMKDIRYHESGGSETRNMVFNARKGSAFEDRAVRQAVAAVLDRSQIANLVFEGTVTPLYSLIPQGISGHSTAFYDAYPQPSAASAKSLLREANVSTPVSFTLGINKRGTNVAEAENIKKQLDESGLFKVKVDVQPDFTTFQKAYAAGKFDAYNVGWIPDFPDPDNFTAPLIGSDSSMLSGFSDPAVQKLITRTQSYSDRGMAANDFRELQRQVALKVPMLPIWQKKDYVVSREAVTGAQFLSDGTGVWRLGDLNWL
ncbi:ABC transporter substrate-binding protein [Streptomyces sp. NPDC093225]|uniref:ABC transporter substrate-binding protein n=1 Tax=Streptomyces sp. NPDC093225 TaxID=3366034 RepID=UPI0038195D3C